VSDAIFEAKPFPECKLMLEEKEQMIEDRLNDHESITDAFGDKGSITDTCVDINVCLQVL